MSEKYLYRGRGLKRHNEYALAVPDFRDTPKTVFAALAYALAMRLSGDNHEAALETLRGEWSALHTAGIVPQHPPNIVAVRTGHTFRHDVRERCQARTQEATR